jgi:DNA-binding transcriptional ArsR family regulator
MTRKVIENLGERKEEIIRVLLEEGEISVAGVQRRTGIPRSSLNHHLGLLERDGVVLQRKTSREVLNRVNPKFIQRLRERFGIRRPMALISGYTYDPSKGDVSTLGVLQDAVESLEKEGKSVVWTVAFTTPIASKEIRRMDYRAGDEEVPLEFEVYQTQQEEIKLKIRDVIEQLLPNYEVILDLTPLTKLFTIVSLSLAGEYGLRGFYHFGPKNIWI